LFVSGARGLDNVYLANGDLSSARAITNISTRAMTPEIDLQTNELYFARLHASGTRMHVANKADWMDAAIIPPVVDSLVENKFPQVTEEIPEVAVERRPYRALPYMVPRYWIPFVYFFPGGTYFSAGTSSSDPVGEHTYGLQTSYDSLSKAASFEGLYVNSQIPNLEITASAASVSQYVFSADVNRRVNTGMIAGQFPLTLSSTKWFGEVGTRFQEFELSGRKDSGLGAFAGVIYKDVSQRGYQISPEKGGNFSLEHTYLFPHVGSLQYEMTDFSSSYYFSKWLPKRHALATFFNATYAPRLRNTLYGRTTSAAVYSDPILANDFIMRGYPSGGFLGRTILNANIEYRFPIKYPYRGWGTKPIFTQRVHGALFGDVITTDGFAYDSDRDSYFRTRTNHAFVGYGAEARVDLTMFYYLPVRFTFGIYNGADQRAGLGWYPFMGFSI
jgi:hypothetical protein